MANFAAQDAAIAALPAAIAAEVAAAVAAAGAGAEDPTIQEHIDVNTAAIIAATPGPGQPAAGVVAADVPAAGA